MLYLVESTTDEVAGVRNRKGTRQLNCREPLREEFKTRKTTAQKVICFFTETPAQTLPVCI
jgi:hypothetical protein